MSLEEVKELYSSGSFTEALKILEESDISDNTLKVDGLLLKAKILFHRGNVKEALDQFSTLSPDDLIKSPQINNFKLFLHAIQGQYQMIEEIVSKLNKENYYTYMCKGILCQKNGKYDQANNFYESAIETTSDNFEKAIAYYKLATSYQSMGLYNSANESLKKNFELIMNSENFVNKAATLTLIGQNHLLSNNFSKAKEYLLKAVRNWEDLNSPFGLSWALGEVAVLLISNGQKKEGLDYLLRLFENIKEQAPIQSLSNHLTNIIKCALDLNERELALKYLNEFESLIKQDKYLDQGAKSRFDFANSIVQSRSPRISEAISVISKFEELTSHEDYIIQLESFIHQSRLLLIEFKITEDELTKKNLLKDLNERNEVLLKYLQTNQNVGIELQASQFQSSLEKLVQDPQKVLSDLNATDENGKNIINGGLLDTNNELDDFNWRPPIIDKDIHSIPKLKILLYLLPRICASFSDLQAKTELSSGNLTGQCQKLEEIGFIDRYKIFDHDRPITMFRITPLGFQEFRKYANDMIQYLNDVL